MNSNDCSICIEAITAETGKTTLGCGHIYHMGCINGWFYAAAATAASSHQGGDVACPYCRKVVTEEEWSPPSQSQTIHAAAAAVNRIEVAKLKQQNEILFIAFLVLVFLFTLLLNPVKNVQIFFWALGYLIDPKILTCQCQQEFF
jgi:hypothetical protein